MNSMPSRHPSRGRRWLGAGLDFTVFFFLLMMLFAWIRHPQRGPNALSRQAGVIALVALAAGGLFGLVASRRPPQQ